MKVFVAGASGVIGRPLVRQLVAAGYEVTGMTRREQRARRSVQPARPLRCLRRGRVTRAGARAFATPTRAGSCSP
jgi:nucleoside-diphosphate-sugar epimerase